ncbi:MAG: hypothetical protein NWQ13_02470, partial [Glaciimonas sp.]|nr:hypothetical protein [Glaciimonas sp.]
MHKNRISVILFFRLFFLSATLFALPFANAAAITLAQQVERFTASLATAPAAAHISLRELQQFNEALIRPASLYPAFNQISL